MKILAEKLINKFYNYIEVISKKDNELKIALPEFRIVPKKIKMDYIYDIGAKSSIVDIVKKKYEQLTPDAFVSYIIRITVLKVHNTDETLYLEKHFYVEWVNRCYDAVRETMDDVEHSLIEVSDGIQLSLIRYNVTEAVRRQLSENNGNDFDALDLGELNSSSKAELSELHSKFKQYQLLYESIVSKAERLFKELKKEVFSNTAEPLTLADKRYSEPYHDEKSIIRLYLKLLTGRDTFLSRIYKSPHIKSVPDIVKKYSDLVLNKVHKKTFGLISFLRVLSELIKRVGVKAKLTLLKIITDTLFLFTKHRDTLSLDDLVKIAGLNREWAKLKLNALEIKQSPFMITSFQTKSKTGKEYEDASKAHSLALQDEILLKYVRKPALSVKIADDKRFSLLNGVSLLFLFICISLIIAITTVNLTHSPVELHPITETARILNTSPDIYGKDNGNVSTIDDLMLTSFSQDASLDKDFISQMKLNTSIGIMKDKEIRENIVRRITENEEKKEAVTFDQTFESIREEQEEQNGAKDDTASDSSNEGAKSKNEALEVDEPLSLPDYSEYTMKIEPHKLDLSIKSKKYSIEDFKQPIIRLQARFDDWYEQTEVFFSKNASAYNITKEHQIRYLNFIGKLDPVKIFESYNFQYQNYPYLLDRIIKDDMPVIYTASSTDAREFGLWSKQGIGIFYDLSSYDVFKQTLLHEMTHDLVERVYGTPIILEGITEMLAMNLMAYLNGEGFSHYKGPVRVAQYLYNRNPKAVIDYYIGIRKDAQGRDIDIFNKNYVTRNFLIDGVDDDIARDNAELIHSMLDIPFYKLLRLNRTVIPLQSIINTHKEYTPLVMQADFNYEGLKENSITSKDALNNIDSLILPRLRAYTDDEKKVAFYTLLAVGNTLLLLEKDEKLNNDDKERLKLIRVKFEEMQKEIKEKNLLYEENELSEKSKEILKESYKSTYSDKEHQKKLNEYQENADTENAPLSEDYSEDLSTDEKELMQEEMKKEFQKHYEGSDPSASKSEGVQDGNAENAEAHPYTEEQLKEAIEKELRRDVSSYIQLMNSYNASSRAIRAKYDELLQKYGAEIKPALDKLTQEQIENRLGQYDPEELSKLPNSLDLIKKRFDLMVKATREDDTQSEYYTDVNDPSWLAYLSMLAQDDYSIVYYELLIERLMEYEASVDTEKTLKSLKKVVSYVNTVELLTRYKDDLKDVVSGCPSNYKGIQALSRLNKHLKGLVHPYVKSEILAHLSEFIMTYIESYPATEFEDVLTSSLVDHLSNAELLNILDKALRLKSGLESLLDYLSRYEDEYSKTNIMPFAERFVSLYKEQLRALVKDSYHSKYTSIIYRTEKTLLHVFGKSERLFESSDTMKNLYRYTSRLLRSKLRDVDAVKGFLDEIDALSEREKHVLLFNLSTQLNDIGWISLDNFNRVYNKVFLNELNLYDSYSGEFIELIIRIGREKAYSKNLYSLIENAPATAYYYYDKVWQAPKSLLDYLSEIRDDELKTVLSTYIVEFLSDFAEYNQIENSNIFFVIGSTLDKYITESAFEKLIQLRYSLQGESFLNIPMITELNYLILKMMVQHPHLIIDGLSDNIRAVIMSICGIVDGSSYDDYSLLKNLFIKEEGASVGFEDSFSTMGVAYYYYQIKTLHYKSNIAGMMCYVYNKGYRTEYGNVFLSQLLGFYGFYLSMYNDELMLYNKFSFEIGELLAKRYSDSKYRPANVIYSNPEFAREIESLIIEGMSDEPEKSFELFLLIAYENWFWRYLTRTSNEKDELIVLLREQPQNYGATFNKGFMVKFFKEFLFTEGYHKYNVIRAKLLEKRDFLIPFLFSKKDVIKALLKDALKEGKNKAVTFLYRMMMGNYLTTENIHIDFFVEGGLVRSMLKEFLLEDNTHFEKLYYSLPKSIITEFDYEEELRRNLINTYYHIFQTLPPQEHYLNDLLSIYKTTLKQLLDKSSDEPKPQKDRIEEEFSKIANLMYLINNDESKKQTAETMYPLVEQFVERMEDNNEYLFANYVRQHVENKSLQLKWNILDSIKSYAFNYKAEAGRVYEKMFYGVGLDILLPYRDYLTQLMKSGYNVPPTEYRVLLETIHEQESKKTNDGLDVMKEAYENRFDSAKKTKLALNNTSELNIVNLISHLKNLIRYSSKEKTLSEVKENIVVYSKEISAVFRDLMEKTDSERNIRLLVGEMAKEIIKLPITDKIGLFMIFSNLLIDYDTVSVTEYKYYTTLIEYLLPNLFENAEPEHYPILTKFIDDIALIIVYIQESIENEPQYYDPEQSGVEDKYYSLMVMYSHYINIVDMPDSTHKLNEYILGLYLGLNRMKLSKEEEAVIASNLLRTQNYYARMYVNEYFKTPIFRRYLEEISDMDRSIIFTGTQQFIDWLSTIRIDYDNPLSNKYLIDIIGIESYIDNLKSEGKSNSEIASEMLRMRNRFTSRISVFFTETYGYPFKDPANLQNHPF